MSFGKSGSDLFYAPALAILGLYVVPVLVMANNAADMQNFDVTFTTLVLAALSLAGAAVLLLIAIVLQKVSAGALLLPLRFVFFLLFAAGIFLPLTKNAGQIEVTELPLHKEHLLYAVLAAVVLFAVSLTKWHRALIIAVSTYLAFSAVSTTVLSFDRLNEKNVAPLLLASSEFNIFVLSFDGLPGPVSRTVIEGNPDLAAALKDFRIFENTVAGAPATLSSITKEITGIANLKTHYDVESKILKTMRRNPRVIINRLSDSGFEVSTFGVYNMGFRKKERAFGYDSLAHAADTDHRFHQIGELLGYSIARMASSWLVPPPEFFRWLADFEKSSPAGMAKKSLVRRVEEHAGSKWEASYILTSLDFEQYAAKLAVGTDKPVAQFLHFVHTHFPVDFDQSCAYRSDDEAWHKANQNQEGVRNQAKCAFSQFQKFLDRLRAIGVYDKSLIVLKSDHGEPVAYNDPEKLESFAIRNHAYWGMGRYIPFLAVKLPGTSFDKPVFDQRPAALWDLAKSICVASGKLGEACNDYDGYNIFDPDTKIPDDAKYIINIVKAPESGFKMDDHEEIVLPRTANFLEVLNDRLVAELITEKPGCDREIALDRKQRYNNGFTDGKTWVTWRDGPSAFLRVRRPDCRLAAIEIQAAPGVAGISVDGRPVAFHQGAAGGTSWLVIDDIGAGQGGYLTVEIRGTGAPPEAWRFRSDTSVQ